MVFLVHHADAVDPLVDPQRPLSASGRAHVDRLVERAVARAVKPAVIWHSGKLRARQTAEPFWRACNPLAEFSAARGLQPEDPPEWIRDVVNADPRDIMLVGHMPHLARLFELLQREPARAFPLHGLLALERGELTWSEAWREE